jgi:hypothetical protein
MWRKHVCYEYAVAMPLLSCSYSEQMKVTNVKLFQSIVKLGNQQIRDKYQKITFR